VIIVNTADECGGSEMPMLTLERFFERGIDAWLLLGDKKTAHPRLVPFARTGK
jgi:hypothetical protein